MADCSILPFRRGKVTGLVENIGCAEDMVEIAESQVHHGPDNDMLLSSLGPRL
jgi:hypothetical protein